MIRAGDLDVDAEHLPGALCDDRVDLVEATPVLSDDEQGAAIRPAERVGEAGPVALDAIDDLAAVTDAHRCAAGVGIAAGHRTHIRRTAPDSAFGIDADAVRSDLLGPHPTVRERAVRFDVERGEPSGDRLGHDEG